ncbi:ScbR family autoregulator-binding transcription factor [Streptomyces sp. NPDC006172]|uniref:ScbR family autoregulator-binding transcription factor n=1 Tax=Streptomyces sp. NPDC006172 TaxID=3154470 RepID=UPI0033C458F2
MAKQDRAIRTRQSILLAAAGVFEERGYQAATISEILAAAGVTKGALYFHFPSKEHLAQGVLAQQDLEMSLPRGCKVQEVVDMGMLHAYRLQSDPMVRAAVRLSLDQHAQGLDRSGPFVRWSGSIRECLETAQRQGELLPYVVPHESAEVMVGAFAGVQAMSQTVCEYQDLQHRISSLLRHVLPNIVVPSVLAAVDLGEDRGEKVFHEMRHLRGQQADLVPAVS